MKTHARRDETSLVINNTNMFAAFDTQKKEKKHGKKASRVSMLEFADVRGVAPAGTAECTCKHGGVPFEVSWK